MTTRALSTEKMIDEEEEEPQLKYHRLGADVTDILRRDEASCLCVAEKMLALGTHTGTVYLLSCAGDEVQSFNAHKAAVQDVCFDEQVETVGSCSDDGTIVVQSLISEEKFTINFHRPLKALALDPRFSSRKTHEVVSGGVSGKLMFSSQGWLGNKNVALHSGQGPIHVVKWSGNLIAWANDHCVRVHNVATHKPFGVIDKPESASPECECHLYWHPDGTLYIGWGSTVIVASLPIHDNGTSLGPDSITTVNRFETEGLLAGVAPFGYQLALLAYMKNNDNSTALRPEIRVFAKGNVEISSDYLSITGFEHYEANDYRLIPCYPTSCHKESSGRSQLGAPSGQLQNYNNDRSSGSTGSSLVQWWRDGEEPLYYIVSPKDIFVGMPRDQLDRVEWLLEHQRFSRALSIASVIRKRDPETWNKAVDRYMEHLISEKKIEEAASLCPELLGDDAVRWERYVYIFAHDNHLGTLSAYVPIENPTLKANTYNMVLRSCITHPSFHIQLQKLVQEWPPTVYSPSALAKEIQNKLHSVRGDRTILMETLARLYIFQNLHDRAMDIYLQLQRPEVFQFMIQHALLRFLSNKIIRLISLDEVKALDLLCDHIEEVLPEDVISEVTNVATQYHHLLVELYADYEPSKLMRFLRNSHQYPLDQAYEICKERGMIKEMVYILSRMGNTHGALQLIISELADIPQAIEFARSQNEDDLWDSLINWAVSKASTTGLIIVHGSLMMSGSLGDLLDHVGGHVDPLRVITRIPRDMEIVNLRNRLCHIISDYRTQTSLQEGCNNILKADCVHLDSQLYSEVRRCIREIYITSNMTLLSEETATWSVYKTVNGSSLPTSEPSIEPVKFTGQTDYQGQDLPSSSDGPLESSVPYPEVRSSLRLGYLSEDSAQNVDYTESMRFKLIRRQPSIDNDALPSLIQ
eukprot:g6058.t1